MNFKMYLVKKGKFEKHRNCILQFAVQFLDLFLRSLMLYLCIK